LVLDEKPKEKGPDEGFVVSYSVQSAKGTVVGLKIDFDPAVLAEGFLPFLRIDVYATPRKREVFHEQVAVPFATGTLQFENVVDYVGLERVVGRSKALGKEVETVEVLFSLFKVIG
jgi:hypothetical protein